jgi:hemerythrin-like domain-containing protein
MAAAYALFLYEHMRGEEEHILKRADLAIERSVQESLAAECRKLDDERLGKGLHDKYLESIGEIRSGLG